MAAGIERVLPMKIGLLGGTFDPPHHGHLIMADEAMSACGLDEVWFLPSHIPPHLERKATRRTTPVHHRIEMVRLAIQGNDRFKLSLVEVERKGRSYTYDTLMELGERYPQHDFHFIIGADMVNDLPKWHRFEEIKASVQFIGLNRPGIVAHPPDGVAIEFVDMPEIAISSSMIRERIRLRQPWRYLLPEAVKTYIEENDLYG